MENEIWKPIKDYEGLYEVSNLGKIKRLSKTIINYKEREYIFEEKIMKPFKGNSGYLIIDLTKNKIRRKFLVHRLVAEAFIPNPENKPCVDHINTIREDNRAENLRWVTRSENCNNELTKKHMSDGQMGKQLSEDTKKKIRKSLKGNKRSEETKDKIRKSKESKKVYCIELNKVFESINEASRELNLSSGHISDVCRGKRKHEKGYHFIYYKEEE